MGVSGYLHALVPSPRKRAHGTIEQKAGWAPLAVCKFWKGEALSIAGSRTSANGTYFQYFTLVSEREKPDCKLLQGVSCVMSLSMVLVTETLPQIEACSRREIKDRSCPVVQPN
jgi:hypothetical protein